MKRYEIPLVLTEEEIELLSKAIKDQDFDGQDIIRTKLLLGMAVATEVFYANVEYTPSDPPSPMTQVIPKEAGILSEAREVGKRWAELLTQMEITASNWVQNGELMEYIDRVRSNVLGRLRSEGWRCHVKTNSKWSVLPPKDYYKRLK